MSRPLLLIFILLFHSSRSHVLAYQQSSTDEPEIRDLEPLDEKFAFDPFIRGTLPTLSTTLDRTEKEDQFLCFSDQANIAIVGSLTGELPETANQISVELLQVSPVGRERVWGVSTSIRENRQFGMTAFSPQRGWPKGLMIVRVAVSNLELVSKEYPVWIIDINENPQQLPPDKSQLKDLTDVSSSRVNVVITPDKIRVLPIDSPLCLCGRFSKPEGLQSKTLVFQIVQNGSTVWSGVVPLLEDDDGLWFETYLNLNGRDLKFGAATLQCMDPAGRKLPFDMAPIQLSVVPGGG